MPAPLAPSPAQDTSRARKLHLLGILPGFTAGAWLGAAEAPTKLVSIGLSPIVISLIMVVGVFLARWSVPALLLGTSSVRADVRRAPHLIICALLAGCLSSGANTMTIFAIRVLGLSYLCLAPLWHQLESARDVLFWLMLGGFIWVIGDLFQQYAAKYVGISRGIPLSNTNQLWGLLWGILVFGELHGRGHSLYAQVIGASFLLMARVAALSLASPATSA